MSLLFLSQVGWLGVWGAPWPIMQMTTAWQRAAWCWQTTVFSAQVTSRHARAARTTNTSMSAGVSSVLKVGLILHFVTYQEIIFGVDHISKDWNTIWLQIFLAPFLLKWGTFCGNIAFVTSNGTNTPFAVQLMKPTVSSSVSGVGDGFMLTCRW